MDNSENSDVHVSLLRQRRNLIGISFILFFYQSSKISISTINILGNEFPIGDPSRVGYILWIAWAYLLLRYYQHYRHSSIDEQLGYALTTKMTDYVPMAALKKFRKTYDPTKYTSNIPLPHEISMQTVSVVGRDSHEWQLKATMHIGNTTNGKQSGASSEYPILLGRWVLLMMRIRAYVHVALHTPFATEYHLPFLIALSPIVFNLYMRFAGEYHIDVAF